MDTSMESVFNPRSVAVIGASEVAGKAAERRTRSLLEGGYDGDVYLINPKRSELFGRKAYPSITAVKKEVDLAMLVVAPRFLVSAVADSVKMGVKGVIIITAGLGETGADGKKIETEILNEAAKTVRYELSVTIHESWKFSYKEDTQLQIAGRPEVFHHTDQNTLKRSN